MLSIATLLVSDITHATETTDDDPNLALAPEEIATLASLMDRYDQVLVDIDLLTDRLQELLETEGGKKRINSEL